MTTLNLTRDTLELEEKATEDDLRRVYESEGDRDRLHLPGLETVLGFLAVNIIVPIFASFASRILYDKYKDMQTKAEAEQAREALTSSPIIQDDPVPEHEVQDELIKSLTNEGVSEQQARQIVADALRRAKRSIGK